MGKVEFTTDNDLDVMAQELNCMKAMLTLLLKALGQADAGKVILKMEKYITELDDPTQAAIFSSTIKQITHAYRQ
ncbi:DUF2594 family protein [Biostraticola tofi]|uniref:Uncharacterized protein DUF2594 n=1 Tax=Biostraticola tofi TaxID=466109 RepID=A0A4R3YY94_9GAMM|nr:DUF2594 family protein [Biostraticola tofi]TCV98207.1 uncharacterized protein DUF2594 [Biostraticola tofi]